MSKSKINTGMEHSWQNDFKIIEELGKGGNAKVFHVKRKVDGYEFALKHLYNRSEEKKCRFIDEIHITKENYKIISGIIPIIESSEMNYWYTMPVSKPILDYIKTSRANIVDIIKGVVQLSDTLIKLHSKGIAHRDIKPSNIYFYEGRYFIGDFGLVEFPDNPNDFTRTDKGLGAIFTIAPEMKRDPKNADGKKADVFSLAKTVWMLITGDERGFDGVYNFLDRTHSLRFINKFQNTHLVELEALLTEATNNNPDVRPNIELFKQQLEMWLDIYGDFNKSQISDWNFINKYLFGDSSPESCKWTKVNKIIDILNVISTLPAFNHMLFSDMGGLDFNKAELANEVGCINIYDTLGYCNVVKPKCLHYETFNENIPWNYFLLEFDTLPPALDSAEQNSERLVEDYPANYVSARYCQYGVYDYDSGEPLPEGFRVVTRYLKGKILFVLKNGPYNSIPATYDGRHGMCSSIEFREYIEKMINLVDKLKKKGYEEKEIMISGYFTENPFEKKCYKKEESYDIQWKDPSEFITANYSKWCFKDLLVSNQNNSAIMFYFRFKENNYLTSQKLYLCNDGYIRRLDRNNLSKVYYTYNRDLAINLCKEFYNIIKINCIGYDFDSSEGSNNFSIRLKRTGKPVHLFTKLEIKEAMCKADDRHTNMLVIDENGFAHVIQDINRSFLYPVRNESWGGGGGFVGKYSDLSTIDNDYLTSLQGWLSYLESGESVYMDYTFDNRDIENLIEKIMKYY
jgi:serine/threonine protein kinase